MKLPQNGTLRGAINLGCLGILIALGLMIGGGQGLYTALKNREPHRTTVREFVTQKPGAEWVTFTGASLNLLECAYIHGLSGAIKEVFIPVRDPGDLPGSQVHVLLATKQSSTLNALSALQKAATFDETRSKLAKKADQGDVSPKILEEIASQSSNIFMKRDVTGVVRFGIKADSKTRDKLAGLKMNLASDFVIINEGEEPGLLSSLLMLCGGMVLGFLLLVARSDKASDKRPAAGLPPPLPPS